MVPKTIFGSIALTCILCMNLEASWIKQSPTPKPSPYCGTSPHPMRVTARHIEGKGVGYNQGYTTVEGFFSPVEPWNDVWVPFIDLRGHVFNSGKMAANGGLGIRHLSSSRIWGANAYYDYRNTHHQHYNQFSIGFESLGKIWDFRINGYLPLGTTKSSYYHTRFDKFKGHKMYVSRKREFALKGANAEAGAHVDSVKNFPFYFAAGPYYLEGRGHKAWGGELRAALDIFEYVRIEGNTSYDNIFKWIGQGQISVNIPLGGKRKVVRNGNSCSTALALSRRAVQRVDRNEIIPVDTQRKTSQAINPATGQPYFFIFVNNTSHSLGTFGSPYPTLLQAQNASLPNQVIYVFPGDGTTTGMASGITLQNGQMLLGASVAHTISTTAGSVTIPSMASTLPNITNTTGNVVTLANNNTVSGFLITANQFSMSPFNGIAGVSVANLTATQNAFLTTAADTNGIFLTNPTGTINIGTSSFDGFANSMSQSNGNGIFVLQNNGGTLDTLNVSGSTFTNISDPLDNSGGCGILADFEGSGGTIANFIVSESTFNDVNNFGAGIFVLQNAVDSKLTNFAVLGCTFSNISDSSGVQANLNSSGSTINSFSVSGCTFSNINDSNGVAAATGGSGSTINSFSVSGCTFSNLSNSNGVLAETIASGSTINNFSVSRCAFSNINNGGRGIHAVQAVAGSTLANFSVSRCAFSNINSGGNGIHAVQVAAGSTLANFSVSECAFSSISSSGVIAEINASGSTLTNLSVTKSTFNNIVNNGEGIVIIAATGTIPTMNVSGNTFTGPEAADGYAVLIDVNTGTTCLEFKNNTATPASTPIPYQFVQTGGTFNRTTGSDSSTNIGQISTSGTVNPPGSCTE